MIEALKKYKLPYPIMNLILQYLSTPIKDKEGVDCVGTSEFHRVEAYQGHVGVVPRRPPILLNFYLLNFYLHSYDWKLEGQKYLRYANDIIKRTNKKESRVKEQYVTRMQEFGLESKTKEMEGKGKGLHFGLSLRITKGKVETQLPHKRILQRWKAQYLMDCCPVKYEE